MSYNIDTCSYVTGQLEIRRSIVRDFYAKHEDELAEDTFIEELDAEGDGFVAITRPAWCGGFSGRSLGLLKRALSLTRGTADLALVWEGGDSITGLRVVDGMVQEMDVEYRLVPSKEAT